MLLRLSWAELWAGRKRLWAPGLAFAFSLAALSLLLSLEQKIQSSLETQGREILGGDMKLEAPRQIREDETEKLRAVLPSGSQIQTYTELNTMLAFQGQSRLVRLHAVQNQYPYYGLYQFEGAQIRDLSPEVNQILVSNELADLLSLKAGSSVDVGGKSFRVTGILKSAPPSVSSLFQISFPVWIHEARLRPSGLIDRPGRIESNVLIEMPPAQSDQVFEAVTQAMDDPMIRIDRYDQADRGFQNLYQQIRFFAQFVSVLALLLAGISVLGALQNWLYERRLLVASLRTFGASSFQILRWTLQSTLIFSFFFASLGVLSGRALNFWVSPALEKILPFKFVWEPGIGFDFAILLFGMMTVVIFSIGAQAGAAKFRPLLLLRSDADASGETKRISSGALISWASLLVLFFALSLFVLQSYTKALQLTGGAMGLVILAFGLASLLLWMLSKVRVPQYFYLSYSLRALTRQRRSTILSAATLFCVSALLSLIVFIQEGLKSDFRVEEGVAQASVFAFDLGDPERVAVEQIISDKSQVKSHWAAWVRVKWLKKNDQDVEVKASERLFDPTEMNLGIAEALPEGNRIIAGEFWEGKWNKKDLPALSVTRDFARQMNIQIGDKLLLDLWGVSFEVRVTNFRSVRWTDFHPAFRVLIQSGFLEDLPLSYVASFSVSEAKDRQAIMGEFSKKLPAVSVIDLSKVKHELVTLTDKLTFVLVSILFFLMGLAFVLMLALAQEKTLRRQVEFAQLKVLGASSNQVRSLILWEYLLVISVPLCLGMAVGIGLGSWVLDYFFNIEGDQAWSWWLVAPLALGVVMAGVATLSSQRLIKARPLQLFAD